MNERKETLNKRYNIDQILTKGADAKLEAVIDKKNKKVISESSPKLNSDDLKIFQEAKGALRKNSKNIKDQEHPKTSIKSHINKSRER